MCVSISQTTLPFFYTPIRSVNRAVASPQQEDIFLVFLRTMSAQEWTGKDNILITSTHLDLLIKKTKPLQFKTINFCHSIAFFHTVKSVVCMPGDPLSSLYVLWSQAGTHCLPWDTKNSPFAVGKDDALWFAFLFFLCTKEHGAARFA